MSVPQANAIIVGRPLSLFEALLLALASHAAILAILFLLGLLSMLSERPLERSPDHEIQVRFNVAPEAAGDEAAASGAAEPSDLPPTPSEAAVPEGEPDAASPDPDAAASLDEPQSLVVPVPSQQPVPPEQGGQTEPPLPAVQPETEADSDEPPSDGLLEGVEQGDSRELEVDADEPIDEPEPDPTAEDLSSGSVSAETELELPETDDGDLASLEQPSAQSPVEPPALGRPSGPSLDERISDYSRALQRYREAVPSQPARAPSNVFEPDWPNLPPTGQALGNLTFESGDFDWEDYGRQIYWVIWRAWHNRLLARVDDFEKWAQKNETWFLDHVNAVQFTIESNGEISSIVLEAESGSVPFDLSAVEGLDEAVLPPLPDDFPRDSETVHANFIGHGPIASMRRGLQAYKSRGWF